MMSFNTRGAYNSDRLLELNPPGSYPRPASLSQRLFWFVFGKRPVRRMTPSANKFGGR